VTRIWERKDFNVPEKAGVFHGFFSAGDDRKGTFHSLQIIAAFLFTKIYQYLMPAPIIERQREGVI
jgi:hypothetical protein